MLTRGSLCGVVVGLAVWMSGAGVQPDLGGALWKMRYSNSTGEFAEAVRQGDLVLAREGMSAETIADVQLHRYFALKKMGNEAGAAEAMEKFEAAAAGLGEGSSLTMQMLLLRRSLGEAVAIPMFPRVAPVPILVDLLWKHGAAADVGMAGAALEELRAHCEKSGADGLLVARRGTVVVEWYSPLYREPVLTMSSVKSIAALVAGLLVEEGKLDIDAPVSRYVPEWGEGLAAKATVRHVLTMTAGLPRRRDMGVAASGERGFNAYVAGLAPEWEPGTKWDYSNEGAQLLSVIMERAAGEPVWQYAQRKLFEPMGLKATALRRDRVGNTNTFADAPTTLRELARFGELMIDGGKVGEARVVPEAWIRAVTTACPQSERYGMMWWLYEGPPPAPRVWAMQGYLGTSVWAFPELDVVVCRVQSRPYLHATEEFEDARVRRLVAEACGK